MGLARTGEPSASEGAAGTLTAPPEGDAPAAPRRARWRLGFAAAAVLLAAADTYVVVLALPAIMTDLGLSLDHLEAAAPIVSGFLLGYVALLPLLGRLSDIAGRVPVFAGCLLTFAFGSLVTASAQDLSTAVAGRALQGAGGGGLVPVTLAIVADLWPVGRRGLPLGVVGAVQELGSVLGPLYGAAILSLATPPPWRLIFWLNLPLAALLGGGFLLARSPVRPQPQGAAEGGAGAQRTAPAPAARHVTHRFDLVGGLLVGLALAAGGLAVAAPGPLASSEVWGVLWSPLAGGSAWSTPLAIAALAAGTAAVAWGLTGSADSPRLFRPRRLPDLWRRVDAIGGLLLAVVLAFIVVSFSTADPSHALVAPAAAGLLPGALILAIVFAWWERRGSTALLPLGELSDPAAAGALITNLAIGAGLMAALVDVPIFARATAYPDSQLGAALVLLRLLAAVPVGAVLGGLLCERLGYRLTTLGGMALATAMFVLMGQWTASAVGPGLRPSDPILVGCGLGFGLAIAPINAAILGAVGPARHGLAASLVVVARMVGMLVGISLLTAIGLYRYNQEVSRIPPCPGGALSCTAYNTALQSALLDELRTIFLAAAVCTAVAGLLGLAMLRRRRGGATSAMEAALGA
ncbi:MAG TPA: MFS transporter [Candidatus Binatia bacterium]|nr:MFS transporter [Candidatus Binatia bacterium]